VKLSGAQQATGEIIVFLDCDLTPVHGSFYDLVSPLFEEKQVASAGHTYFPLINFISKAYSLFWYFPLYRDPQTLGKHQAHASNLALKREWFTKTGFEVQHGGFKVCCFLLAQRLKNENRIISHPDVWFKHELWNNTLSFFIWRATVAGRDHDKKFAIKHTTNRPTRLKAAVKSLLSDIKRVYSRHIKYHRLVQLSFFPAILSFFISICFFSILRITQAISALSPLKKKLEFAPDNFTT
jgi:glycosyltransferase involved in cell wall biosynthesis